MADAPAAKPAKRLPVKRLNVALQGGGAHGAFTWGVLDRLLDDERIEIEAISGTSAGAMNGVVLAEGLVEGGRQKAKQQLSDFWRAVSEAMNGYTGAGNPWAGFIPTWLPDINPALAAFQALAQMASPYDFNPLDFNPLREIVLSEVDFDRVHQCRSMQLFVAATNVQNGAVEVFTGDRVTIDSLMASACLPMLYKAVEIDGVPYWDGGYTGNPVLKPFLTECSAPDVLIVQINPKERQGTPRASHEILDRLNEITFNASLMREIEQIQFVNDHLRNGNLAHAGYREIFLHRIGGGQVAEGWSVASKLSATWDFLQSLYEEGRRETDAWLKAHFDDIGVRDTLVGD